MFRTNVNKSAWIRAQPASLSAKEVVETAKREGLSVSAAMVYTVRSLAAKAAKSNVPQRVNSVSRGQSRRAPDISSLRAEFQQVAVRLGTEEAQRLLKQLPPLVLAQL